MRVKCDDALSSHGGCDKEARLPFLGSGALRGPSGRGWFPRPQGAAGLSQLSPHASALHVIKLLLHLV